METLPGGYTLSLSAGAFPLSTDSMVLADFVRLPRDARVLDLGSGCATLGVLLCAVDPGCHVTGIELSKSAHDAALSNIDRNHLRSRLASICGDLRTVAPELEAGSFHCCVSNPPYFSAGPLSKDHPTARRDDLCSTEELFCAAARVLRYGGDFFLVHRPEKLAELCACGTQHGLEAKRLRLVRHKRNGPVALILLQLRKGGKPGLVWEEEALHHEDGTITDYYKRVYHLQEA